MQVFYAIVAAMHLGGVGVQFGSIIHSQWGRMHACVSMSCCATATKAYRKRSSGPFYGGRLDQTFSRGLVSGGRLDQTFSRGLVFQQVLYGFPGNCF